jgi:hypothetical protein
VVLWYIFGVLVFCTEKNLATMRLTETGTTKGQLEEHEIDGSNLRKSTYVQGVENMRWKADIFMT